VESDKAALREALREAMGLSDQERFTMGKRGRQWVKEDFSWRRAASEMRSVYAWMLNDGLQPHCVQLN
jgi:glycogen synthase